jgi:hypothetical protein
MEFDDLFNDREPSQQQQQQQQHDEDAEETLDDDEHAEETPEDDEHDEHDEDDEHEDGLFFGYFGNHYKEWGDINAWYAVEDAQSGDVDELRAALDAGLDVNLVADSESLLMHAASHGEVDVVDLLLQRGAHVGDALDGQNAPLHSACYYNYTEVVKRLVAAGCNINAIDRHGATPFWIAVEQDYKETATFLIDAGTDVKLLPPISGVYNHVHARVSADIAQLVEEARPRHAASLLSWQLAMAPLELPICMCVNAISMFSLDCAQISILNSLIDRQCVQVSECQTV